MMNKSTGYISIDAVIACMLHCRRFNKRIKTIRLCHSWWYEFSEYTKRTAPDYKFNKDEGIILHGVVIIEGHAFQKEKLEYDLLEAKKPALA